MANQLTTTEQLTTIPGRKRDRKRLIKKYPGVIQEVSKRTGKHASYLYRVFYGKEPSAPMVAALLDGFNRRIDSEHKAAGTEVIEELTA